MPPILPYSQILGASDNQESGLDKEIVERNVVESMRNKKSEGLDLSDFNWETFDAVCTSRNREDVDSIASGNRTDGDCSISSVYESDNRVVIPPLSHPHISQNSQIPDFVEYAASWRDDWESGSDKGTGDLNDEGMRDRKSVEEVLDWSGDDWNWDYIEAYNSSGTNGMEGTKYREDINSIASGTNTDGYSENEAISRVYESDNTVQRPGFSFYENGEGIKRNSWGDIGSARKNYRSTSGASRAGNQHMGFVPKPPFHTRSSVLPLSASPYPDNSTTLNSSALSAEGNTEKIVYSAPEIILKEAALHIGHNVADRREAHTSKREQESEKNISYTRESLSQHFGRPLDDARKRFGVSRTAFKAMCRDVGITRWKYGKRNMGRNSSETRRKGNFPSGMPPVQFAPVVAHKSQNLNKITVKATYNGAHIRFNLPDLSGISELEENVIKRLHLERNTFTIKYLDDDGEWMLCTCDEDVQECIEISRSLGTTKIKMLIN